MTCYECFWVSKHVEEDCVSDLSSKVRVTKSACLCCINCLNVPISLERLSHVDWNNTAISLHYSLQRMPLHIYLKAFTNQTGTLSFCQWVWVGFTSNAVIRNASLAHVQTWYQHSLRVNRTRLRSDRSMRNVACAICGHILSALWAWMVSWATLEDRLLNWCPLRNSREKPKRGWITRFGSLWANDMFGLFYLLR